MSKAKLIRAGTTKEIDVDIETRPIRINPFRTLNQDFDDWLNQSTTKRKQKDKQWFEK